LSAPYRPEGSPHHRVPPHPNRHAHRSAVARGDTCDAHGEATQPVPRPVLANPQAALLVSVATVWHRPGSAIRTSDHAHRAVRDGAGGQRRLAELETGHFLAGPCNGVHASGEPAAAKCSNKSATWWWWTRLFAAGEAERTHNEARSTTLQVQSRDLPIVATDADLASRIAAERDFWMLSCDRARRRLAVHEPVVRPPGGTAFHLTECAASLGMVPPGSTPGSPPSLKVIGCQWFDVGWWWPPAYSLSQS
jgi:hypothetical protein